MTHRHPLPEPTLVQRLGGLLVIELALLAAIVLAGCGEKSTAPVATQADGPCWVIQYFPLADGRVATLRVHYAVCPSDSLLAAKGWRREP